METFLGKKFKNVTNDNMEPFLLFMDVNFLWRKLALFLSPTWYIVCNEDGTYTVSVVSAGFLMENTFNIGEEFAEQRPDGVMCKTKYFMEGETLVHLQQEIKSGKKYRHEKCIDKNFMISTTTAEGWEGKYVGVYEQLN